MRPDLPWNVAGIPTEAHEAARAAARREGLSVGEWLTRRILRSFADAGDEEELTRDSFAASKLFRDEAAAPPPRRDTLAAGKLYLEEPALPPSRRDTDDMLDRVSRSTVESNVTYRRIEEQLKGVSRRVETSERSQAENNRALSRAATEMSVATREQAQAFEQLGTHVVSLKERIDRVEQASRNDSLKEAVKGLHTGLERLADQLTQNANQSATQISALATNLETLAGHVGETRANTETTAQILEQRIAELDDRIYATEKTSKTNAVAVDNALEELDASYRDYDAQAEKREAAASGAIARLEESIRELHGKSIDSNVEARISSIEKTLGEIASRFEDNAPATARQIEDSLKKLLNRVEATENRQRDSVSEFRAALNETAERLRAFEAKLATGATARATFEPASSPQTSAAVPNFDAPPFPDVQKPSAPPPFAAPADPFPEQTDPFAQQAAFDASPPVAEEPSFEPAATFTNDAFAAEPNPEGDAYLSAARRSALDAANAAEAEQVESGLAWSSAPKQAAAKKKTGEKSSSTVLIAFISLIAIALVAGFILSQGFGGKTLHPSNAGSTFTTAPAPQAATPLHATSQADDIEPHAPASMPVPDTTPETTPAAVPPLPQKTVRAAPVHQASAATVKKPETIAAKQPPVSSLDRLTALANGGNAKAETVVGLKYLNGDGTAENDVQAAKWLQRAASAGEPIAQYRLGYLYERGKGVPADPAKATHWYQASAMQGNRKAMHNLAVAYAEGNGTKKDVSEAARWFSKAATMGLTDSQFNLAVLYERGQGVPQSLIDAYKWYAIAAIGGDTESKSRVDAMATQLSADDRAAAQHAVDTFRPAQPDPRANATPQQSDLPQG